MQILMIEDEPKVADFVRRGLRAEGWHVDHAHSAEDGLEFLRNSKYDIVLLDLMLPGMSGDEMCRRLRSARNQVPILMLSALGSTEDRVNGLRTGADDYLPKPFDFDELIARMDALHRRSGHVAMPSDDTELKVGPLRFHRDAMQVFLDGEEMELSAKERDLLVMLMKNAGRVCARERILNTVWGVDTDPLTNVVDVTVSRVRRQLSAHSDMIKTVRGYGYRLEA